MGKYDLKQKCWTCSKSTNYFKCSWVEGILPECAKQDKKGYIVKCDNYEWDGTEKQKTYKEQAKEMNISVSTLLKQKNFYGLKNDE